MERPGLTLIRGPLARGLSGILACALTGALALGSTAAFAPSGGGGGGGGEEGEGDWADRLRLSDEVLPLRAKDIPERPSPLLELGNPFLGGGEIRPGFRTWTGAVWQPSLLVFGNVRTALQTFDTGDGERSEWASRLDLFANLQLSGTERLLFGFRPLDDEGRFTSYQFSPKESEGWNEELDLELQSAYFEGDFGELFPGLDLDDTSTLDWGFSVGRQPLRLQEGLLMDDFVDSLGITRNTLLPRGFSNLRLTGLLGWNDLHRGDNVERGTNFLVGLSAEGDTRRSTLSMDLLWVADEDEETDGIFAGIGAVQRIGHWNTALRAVTSRPLYDRTESASRGTLLFAEFSRELPASHDQVYANVFWGLDEFTSAARDPAVGGPLGRVGILFAAVGLGRFPSPLDNRPEDAVGASFGWQKFLSGGRRQLVLELGGRTETDGSSDGELGLGARYQIAMGRRSILRFDLFGTLEEGADDGHGARVEWQIKF